MLNDLRNYVKEQKSDKTIFDIVLYGSAVKGKFRPNDVDIAVIFREGSLKERLAKIQAIKKKIKIDKSIDIKPVLLEELFQYEFFARSGIFLEGISLFDNKPFSNKIDFEGYSLFTYELSEKTHNEKVKFNYALTGRNDKGILDALGGRHIAAAAILIPMDSSTEFEEVLAMHKIKYVKKNVLMQR